MMDSPIFLSHNFMTKKMDSVNIDNRLFTVFLPLTFVEGNRRVEPETYPVLEHEQRFCAGSSFLIQEGNKYSNIQQDHENLVLNNVCCTFG
jgi:hypothetical protein